MSSKVISVEKVSSQYRIVLTPLKKILDISEGDFVKFTHSESGAVLISKVID